ncbi:hypothetical protein MRB53_025721 [Persea americana]|uniref:Uncharacterized protein n=1 Tax=Persea americana TaxID=3435 RepID=A0ACC2LFZ3_PERAE|nr:hypothetical protein MRB53_025721 [Persea americana]
MNLKQVSALTENFETPWFKSFKATWFHQRRRFAFSPQQWGSLFTPEGKLQDKVEFLKIIRTDGVDPSIRAEVWPFLLGIYDFDSSRAERNAIRKQKRKEYENLRSRIHQLSKQGNGEGYSVHPHSDSTTDEAIPNHGEKNDPNYTKNKSVKESNSKAQTAEDFTTSKTSIRLDALRANAEWIAYSPGLATVPEEQARGFADEVGLQDFDNLEPGRIFHAARLVAILEAYALYDPEIGYAQGMCDLLAPIITVMQEDYEAFWCFVGFMRKARHNFRIDQAGIWRQLDIISKIIRLKDLDLYRHLKMLGAEDCFFVYRMLVVLFRRELSFEQTLCLWEVMWANQAALRAGIRELALGPITLLAPQTDDLLLYAIAACVLQKRKVIIEEYSSMDEILRFCDHIGRQLNIWKLLDHAQDLVATLQVKI